MDADLASRLAQSVRAADPDRYFATLFAPAADRPFLFALYAFNAEVARIRETVSEPMLGNIRLEWWRETVESARKGTPRSHDVARGLAALFAERGTALQPFEALITAWSWDPVNDRFGDMSSMDAWVDSTSGGLMRMAADILGADPHKSDDITRQAGLAYGLTRLVRALPFHNIRHQLYLSVDLVQARFGGPAEEFFHLDRTDPHVLDVMRFLGLRARDYFMEARKHRPGAALAAILPAALVPVYLRKMTRDVPIHRRQMALLSAAMKKRL